MSPSDAFVYWRWGAFAVLVTALLAADLFVFHRRAHAPSLKESAAWTLFWCSLAAAFKGVVWWWRGGQAATEFLTGYIVEWSLSMDNVFVFAVIFEFFRVPLRYQYRVLFWGILGAIFMRLAFILVGVGLIHHFEWVLWIFGAFLVYTAFKLVLAQNEDVDPERNLLLRLARRWLPMTQADHGQRFLARENGALCITPLLLVLLVVESTDVLFAVDSVPAIFGITRDPFILFTSNIFAILGLRALYFLLAGVVEKFRYLSYGLSAVLGFVGLKMIAEYWIAHEGGYLIPSWLSLTVVCSLIGLSILASMAANIRERRLPKLTAQLGQLPALPEELALGISSVPSLSKEGSLSSVASGETMRA
jgi:tellurite resistance protein TerC